MEQVAQELEEMGPIDYVVLAWPGGIPSGDGSIARMIINLVESGIIRILDIGFVAKDADGNVFAVDIAELGDGHEFEEFEGASTGLVSQEDLDEAAAALDPDSAAAVLVWENRWAAPVAVALRKSGGLLLDSGRIPVQGIIAALDALEAAEAN